MVQGLFTTLYSVLAYRNVYRIHVDLFQLLIVGGDFQLVTTLFVHPLPINIFDNFVLPNIFAIHVSLWVHK